MTALWTVGNRVTFKGRHGHNVNGYITKLNDKSVVVTTDSGYRTRLAANQITLIQH